MIAKSICIRSQSAENTYRLGEKIGENLTTGMVILLTGELGSGKTTLIQGLARGLEVPEKYYITSPTYTLINEYLGRHVLFHVDLYRLEDSDDFEGIGLYDILEGEGIAAIEWADKLTTACLSEYIQISFEMSGIASRDIRITACGDKAVALLKGIEQPFCG